ncbi:MAG: polysaccharide export protein [Hyphomicrobiaceae bacterium]|nr:polysaccharide export protein [Hyphomicrobiaceae bacterium]
MRDCKRALIVALLALAACLQGCANGGSFSSSSSGPVAPGGQVPGSQAVGATPAAMPGAPAADLPFSGMTVNTGDKLRITVFKEQELSREYEVDSTGNITIPLIGAVRAAGLMPAQLQESIAAKLRDGYIRDPKVSVELLTQRPFYIIGEVTKSGEYPYRSGMTIMSAVAVAGGYTYRADTGKIFIRRSGQTFERSYPTSAGVDIRPGDIIRIPERYF